MEHKNTILQEIIHEAYRQSQPLRLAEIIKPIYHQDNLHNLVLTKSDLEKLNRLSVKAESFESIFLLGLVYQTVLASKSIQIESLDPDVALSIVNVLLAVYDRTPGTILSRRIIIYIKHMLFSFVKKPELRSEDKEHIMELLLTPFIKQDNLFSVFESNVEIKEITRLLKSAQPKDKVAATKRLMNVFSECSNIEEQLDVFTKKLPPLLKASLASVNSEKDKEFLERIGLIGEHMIYQTHFLLRINKTVCETVDRRDQIDPLLLCVKSDAPKQENKEENQNFSLELSNIISYSLAEYELILKACENLYPTVSLIIDTFLRFPEHIELQIINIKLLQRLFYSFPKLRKTLEEPILKTFANINKNPNEANKAEASAFLYRLVNRDSTLEFQALLQNKEEFKTLYSHPFYNRTVLNNKDNTGEALSLEDLEVQYGFPNVTNIPAGKSFTTYIEVWKPLSILYWSFALKDYDINFTLTRMASFDQISRDQEKQDVVVYKKERIEASKQVCKGTLIVNEPGIFRLDFDNSHSWFNAKILKWNVCVLEPEYDGSDHSIINAPEDLDAYKKSRRRTYETRRSEKSETSSKPTESPTDVKSEVSGVISINQAAIEYHLKTKNGSHETSIHYNENQVNWSHINEKILETTKQAIQVGNSAPENQLNMKIIYDEKALQSLFDIDKQDNKNLVLQLHTALNCLETLRENISAPIKISNKIEQVIERLMESKHLEAQENLYVICIDNFSKRFFCNYKGENKEQVTFNLNNLCVVGEAELGGGVGELKSLSESYFYSESPVAQTTYLATLLINAYNLQNKQVSKFLIFENEPSNVLCEENQHGVQELFKEYCAKIGPLHKGIPEITFCDIKL